jgi:deoxyadenosine/deoxycytidine kinase
MAQTDLFNAFPDRLRYIAVEGVIGAGKTTLARAIARRAGARLVLEEFEANPFLPAFYEDAPRWAFQTQLAFLASRFRQQKALATRDLFQQAVVSDYTFDKDRLFARITLSGDELQLYESLYAIMEPNAPVPDLVVYLRSSVERLLKNIALRARAYEAGMDPAYLAELSGAYDRYFTHYRKGPLLIVSASEIDFVAHPQHLEALLRAVASAGPGTSHFAAPPEAQGRLV